MQRPKSYYARSGQPAMTLELAEEIRRAYFSREATQAELGRKYGRKQHTISRIVSGITWANRCVSGKC